MNGDIHGPKPCEFIWFGDTHGPKPYKFIWFGDIHGPKPYEFIGFGAERPGVQLRGRGARAVKAVGSGAGAWPAQYWQ